MVIVYENAVQPSRSNSSKSRRRRLNVLFRHPVRINLFEVLHKSFEILELFSAACVHHVYRKMFWSSLTEFSLWRCERSQSSQSSTFLKLQLAPKRSTTSARGSILLARGRLLM